MISMSSDDLTLQEKICSVGEYLLKLKTADEIFEGMESGDIDRKDLSNIFEKLIIKTHEIDNLRINNYIDRVLTDEQINHPLNKEYLSLTISSHDIMNVAAPIGNSVYNLLQITDNEFKSEIELYKKDVNYYSSILIDLLNTSFISSGIEKYSFDMSSINLKSYLETKLRKFSGQFNFLVLAPINIKTYQALAISQLVKNASDSYSGIVYNENQKIIDVLISGDENSLAAKVTDYGKGIDLKNLDKIYDNFSSKKVISGNGLMLVKSIIDYSEGVCEYITTQKAKATHLFNSTFEEIIPFDEENKPGTQVFIRIPYMNKVI
jgi:light-regulated signal transduction histidine kinase (bacteriophytochrome)